jgi:hypothetical protein
MRISHTMIDSCLANPRQWYTSTSSAASHPYKMSYSRALQLAILQYHRVSQRVAQQYLDNLIKKHHFKDVRRVTKMESDLLSYIRWATSERVKMVDFKVNISLPSGFLELRGEIGRVDITATGYRAVLFGRPAANWRQQLRMLRWDFRNWTAAIYKRLFLLQHRPPRRKGGFVHWARHFESSPLRAHESLAALPPSPCLPSYPEVNGIFLDRPRKA